jgi:hypothetical protein
MRASLVLLLLLLCVPLRADPVPGADAPGFVAARTAWLKGEDMAALAAFSALARGGNVAAQLMLGTIDQSMTLPDAVAALSRAERIALLRAPGGLSGRNWLIERSGDLPLAAALNVAGNGAGQVDDAGRRAALETLLAAGEARAALCILAYANNVGGWETNQGWDLVAQFAADPALGGHGAPLLGLLHEMAADPVMQIGTPERVARVAAALNAARAPASDLVATRAAMSSTRTLADSGRLAAAQTAAGEAPLAAPLRGICTEACPMSVGTCTFALLVTVGGIPGFLTLSPLESVVPSKIYQKSPRFGHDLRAAVGPRPEIPAAQNAGRRAWLAGVDTCAATVLFGPE